MMTRTLRLLALLPLLGLAACSTPARTGGASPGTPELAWMFDGHIVHDQPAFDVYLEVDGTPHPVVDNAVTEYRELERAEWNRFGIPAGSVTACTSWWAGHGDVLHVQDEGGRLTVHRALLDETTGQGPFRIIKTIAY